MSVAGILSSLGSLQLGAPSAAKQGLQQLKQDLQTGNLNAAQSDFAALQKAFSQSCATSAANSAATTPTASAASTSAFSSSNTTPFSQAVNQLASDLTSNNLAAAQKDLSTLKQDRPQANGSVSAGGARHHHWSGGESNQGSGGTTATSLFSQLSQALASGNMASAQQAYASLQSQQFNALSVGQSSADSPMSMLA
jgi:hypothetical protein